MAFVKLQESIPKNVEKRLVASAKLFQFSNFVLLFAAIGVAVYLGLNPGMPVWWIVLVLVFAGVMGLFVVLPIGGADMPVVISLLNAMTGLSAAAAGLALNNTAMIVAGMIVGASGSILTNLMAKAMNRSIPAIVFGSFGGGDSAGRCRGRRPGHRQGNLGRRRGDPDGLRQPGDRGAGLRAGRRAGPARRQGDGQRCWRRRAWRSSTPSTRWPAACPVT